MQTAPDFIAYIKPTCTPSRKIRDNLNEHPLPNVFLQNVLLLESMPAWMNGTPIVADTKLGLIYKGTDAQVFISKLIATNKQQKANKRIIPPPPLPQMKQQFPQPQQQQQNGSQSPSAHAKKKFSSLFTLNDEDNEGDDAASRDPPKGSKLSEDDINTMMERRSSQVPLDTKLQM